MKLLRPALPYKWLWVSRSVALWPLGPLRATALSTSHRRTVLNKLSTVTGFDLWDADQLARKTLALGARLPLIVGDSQNM